MGFATWQDLYRSDVQGLWGLIAVPLLFLIYVLARGRPGGGALPAAAPFVFGYTVAFTVETIIDPIVGGPIVRALGIAGDAAATVLLILFVLIGDFRVYLLLFALLAIAEGRPWSAAVGRAAAWTMLVPIGAYATNTALHAAVPALGPQTIWPIYESWFTVVALALRARLTPARVPQPGLLAFLRDMLAYVVLYYALWVAADILIQVAGSDLGWLLRVVPNQLYYAFWTPVVYWTFFSRRYQSTSASTQAAR